MVLIMGIIFYLSHLPGDAVRLPLFPGFDKLAHAFAYGSLAGAFLYSLQPHTHGSNRLFIAVLVVLFCIIWGIGDEFHQSFIPGRSVSYWDVVADGVGALLVVGYWFIKTTPKASKDCS